MPSIPHQLIQTYRGLMPGQAHFRAVAFLQPDTGTVMALGAVRRAGQRVGAPPNAEGFRQENRAVPGGGMLPEISVYALQTAGYPAAFHQRLTDFIFGDESLHLRRLRGRVGIGAQRTAQRRKLLLHAVQPVVGQAQQLGMLPQRIPEGGQFLGKRGAEIPIRQCLIQTLHVLRKAAVRQRGQQRKRLLRLLPAGDIVVQIPQGPCQRPPGIPGRFRELLPGGVAAFLQEPGDARRRVRPGQPLGLCVIPRAVPIGHTDAIRPEPYAEIAPGRAQTIPAAIQLRQRRRNLLRRFLPQIQKRYLQAQVRRVAARLQRPVHGFLGNGKSGGRFALRLVDQGYLFRFPGKRRTFQKT